MPRRMSAERVALRQLAYELYVTMPVLSVRVLARLMCVPRTVLGEWAEQWRWLSKRKRYWRGTATRMLLVRLRLGTCVRVIDAVKSKSDATVHAVQSFVDRLAVYSQMLAYWLSGQPHKVLANFGALSKEPNTPRIDRSNARYYSRRAPVNKKPQV